MLEHGDGVFHRDAPAQKPRLVAQRDQHFDRVRRIELAFRVSVGEVAWWQHPVVDVEPYVDAIVAEEEALQVLITLLAVDDAEEARVAAKRKRLGAWLGVRRVVESGETSVLYPDQPVAALADECPR